MLWLQAIPATRQSTLLGSLEMRCKVATGGMGLVKDKSAARVLSVGYGPIGLVTLTHQF